MIKIHVIKNLMIFTSLINYIYIEFDHEFSANNCEPNANKPWYGLVNGGNSIFRKCCYGDKSFDCPLEYWKKFWSIYRINKKSLRIIFTYPYEYYYEISKYKDNSLHDFLKELFWDNQLKNANAFIGVDLGIFVMEIIK